MTSGQKPITYCTGKPIENWNIFLSWKMADARGEFLDFNFFSSLWFEGFGNKKICGDKIALARRYRRKLAGLTN